MGAPPGLPSTGNAVCPLKPSTPTASRKMLLFWPSRSYKGARPGTERTIFLGAGTVDSRGTRREEKGVPMTGRPKEQLSSVETGRRLRSCAVPVLHLGSSKPFFFSWLIASCFARSAGATAGLLCVSPSLDKRMAAKLCCVGNSREALARQHLMPQTVKRTTIIVIPTAWAEVSASCFDEVDRIPMVSPLGGPIRCCTQRRGMNGHSPRRGGNGSPGDYLMLTGYLRTKAQPLSFTPLRASSRWNASPWTGI